MKAKDLERGLGLVMGKDLGLWMEIEFEMGKLRDLNLGKLSGVKYMMIFRMALIVQMCLKSFLRGYIL